MTSLSKVLICCICTKKRDCTCRDSYSQHIGAVRNVDVSIRIFSFRREECTTSLQGNFLVPSHLLARTCWCLQITPYLYCLVLNSLMVKVKEGNTHNCLPEDICSCFATALLFKQHINSHNRKLKKICR